MKKVEKEKNWEKEKRGRKVGFLTSGSQPKNPRNSKAELIEIWRGVAGSWFLDGRRKAFQFVA